MGPHVPEPGPYALPTYEAVHLALNAVSLALESRDVLSRRTVAEVFGSSRRTGRLVEIEWESSRYWNAAPLYLYRWTGQTPKLIRQMP